MTKSRNFIWHYKRRIGLLTLVLTLIAGGVTTTVALLTRPTLHMTVISPTDLQIRGSDLFSASNLESATFPVTLEVEAQVSGKPRFGWGLWVYTGIGIYDFRVRNDGYFSAFNHSKWEKFLPIQPTINKLYLNITSTDWQANFPSDYQVTFRINDEIAWTGTIQWGLQEWGVIQPSDANVVWKAIKVYTG